MEHFYSRQKGRCRKICCQKIRIVRRHIVSLAPAEDSKRLSNHICKCIYRLSMAITNISNQTSPGSRTTSNTLVKHNKKHTSWNWISPVRPRRKLAPAHSTTVLKARMKMTILPSKMKSKYRVWTNIPITMWKMKNIRNNSWAMPQNSKITWTRWGRWILLPKIIALSIRHKVYRLRRTKTHIQLLWRKSAFVLTKTCWPKSHRISKLRWKPIIERTNKPTRARKRRRYREIRRQNRASGETII